METLDVRNQPLRASLVEHVSVNIAVFVVHVSSFVDVDPSYFFCLCYVRISKVFRPRPSVINLRAALPTPIFSPRLLRRGEVRNARTLGASRLFYKN